MIDDRQVILKKRTNGFPANAILKVGFKSQNTVLITVRVELTFGQFQLTFNKQSKYECIKLLLA